ncbi:hypothetical protein SCHPADRAFT_222728 [Schizopora paradoxa]|uniref:Uncharacterized protein n=1 Tax=Schizopora paradoxa TaxID=27342 RepID=A0A0H2S3H4_9AGAM|nr:hypothetical protein SCHPADRAFT_222728 [Schizopora paradoxa]
MARICRRLSRVWFVVVRYRRRSSWSSRNVADCRRAMSSASVPIVLFNEPPHRLQCSNCQLLFSQERTQSASFVSCEMNRLSNVLRSGTSLASTDDKLNDGVVIMG